MRHDHRLDGARYRLRPATREDSAFITELRADPELGRYLNRSSGSVVDQEAWFDRYLERPDDIYLVVEDMRTGEPEGTIGLYRDPEGRAEWGRWILRKGSLAAVESVALLYRLAFDVLGFDRVVCRTLAANTAVVSFHASCGLATRDTLLGYVTLDGVPHDAVEQELTREGWATVRPRLERLAAGMARRAP